MSVTPDRLVVENLQRALSTAWDRADEAETARVATAAENKSADRRAREANQLVDMYGVPAVDREKVARWLYENSDVSLPLINDDGDTTGDARPWEWLSVVLVDHYRSKADALFSSGVLRRRSDHDWTGVSRDDTYGARADDLIASGVLRSVADVKAEGLEEAADQYPGSESHPTVEWLRARAAVLREGKP